VVRLMKTTRRALFGVLLGAGAAAFGIAVSQVDEPPDTAIAACRRPVICGWPTDTSRAAMPCVLPPHHPGTCLPAPPPIDRTTLG